MAKGKPREEDILEVMRATGCTRRKARRALIEASREVWSAYVLLVDALRKGEISARGTNTETGKQENIPASYWSN
jgi:hypothetical protein